MEHFAVGNFLKNDKVFHNVIILIGKNSYIFFYFDELSKKLKKIFSFSRIQLNYLVVDELVSFSKPVGEFLKNSWRVVRWRDVWIPPQIDFAGLRSILRSHF